MAPPRPHPTQPRILWAFAIAALCVSTAAQSQNTPPRWDNAWSRGIVYYRLQVSDFRDTDGDGVGDLPGLIRDLDTLNDGDPSTTDDLGVDAIVLSAIDSRLGIGTKEDFARLIEQAHGRGIRVILEMPLQPCAAPGTHTGGGEGAPAAVDGDVDASGRLDQAATRWLAAGVDGFVLTPSCRGQEREGAALDVRASEIADRLRRLASAVRAANPRAVVIGDFPGDFPGAVAVADAPEDSAAATADGEDLTLDLDYPLADSIVAGVLAEDATGIVTLVTARQNDPRWTSAEVPLLAGRDLTRIAARPAIDPAKLRCAASVLLTLPGSPFLTSADEVGLSDGADAASRYASAMLAQTGDPTSLLNHYRSLIHLRATTQALRTGSIRFLSGAEQGPSIMAFLREVGNRKFLVVHNLGSAPAVAGPFPLPGFYMKRVFEDGRAGDITIDSTQSWRIPMPPHATGIWRVG